MSSTDLFFHLQTLDGVTMYRNYLNYQKKILDFEVYDDDVWVITFPKSGTTWIQEMVWLLVNDLDYNAATQRYLYSRFPFLEMSALNPLSKTPYKNEEHVVSKHIIEDSIDYARQQQRPRLIKTHLALKFLPLQIQNGSKRPKVIYLARNPKDVCVSFYHHIRIFSGYRGTLEEFCKLFLADKIYYCPYWGNVLPFWGKRDDGNVIFLKYEDMKADLPSAIKRVAHFLGKKLNEEELGRLGRHLSFDAMKNNNAVNYKEVIGKIAEHEDFLRKGTVGGYKSEMSEKIIKEFDDWLEMSSRGTGLSFNYCSF